MISKRLPSALQADEKSTNITIKPAIKLPDGIAKINNTLEASISELTEAYIRLSQGVKTKDYYFSANRLHAAVKTNPEESQLLLKHIEDEKLRLTQLIETNTMYWKSLYQNHLDNVSKQREELNKARLDLLNELDKYQQKMDENKINYDEAKAKIDKFNKAKTEFNRIKDKSGSFLFGLDQPARQQAYGKLQLEFSDVARLDDYDSHTSLYKTCAPLISLQLPIINLAATRVPPMREIYMKPVADLKQIAVKTTEASLIAQAAKLEQLSNQVNHQNKLPEINVKALKTDDGNACKTLLIQARIMAATYKTTKKELMFQSKMLFEKIDHQVESICQQLETARLGLSAIRKMFLATSPEMRIYRINNFDKLVDHFKHSSQIYQLAIEQSQQIIENYKSVSVDFDVNHVGWEDSNKRKMTLYMNDMKQALEEAKKEIFNNRNEIHKTKQHAAATELFNSIRYMIQNRVGYWNEQVFSSDYKIGNLKVPHGIADMHSLLIASKNKNVWDTLKAIKQIAVDRKAVGTGWFFKRTMSTTDKFYSIIQNITLEDVTMESVEGLKDKFREIPGLIELKRPRRPPAIMTKR